MAITKRYAHINHVANATQDLLDAASAKISGSMLVGTNVADSKLELTGSLYVSKNAVIKEHLTGTLGALFLDTIKVDQQADMVDVFPQVTDTSDLGSQAKRWDNLFAKTVEAETLSSSVDANFDGTLHVLGDSTFEAGDVFVTLGDVSVAAGKIEATVGDIIALGGTVSASVALKTNGTLGVYGISTLHGAVIADSTLEVAGNADLNGTLDVAGNFIVATNKFTVTATNGNTTVGGNLTVDGDFIVMGESIELQAVQLRVEDKIITLASGSSDRLIADGAGLEIAVGTVSANNLQPTILYQYNLGGASGSWESSLDWIPSIDNKYDLGVTGRKWRHLELSGDANVGGALDVVGEISAAAGMFAASFDADGEAHVGSLLVDGYAQISASLGVEGTVSASAAFSGGSLDVDGTADVGGTATFGGLATFNAGGTVPASQTFTIANGATLNVLGTANYVNISATGNISAAGALTGSALRIHGVDLSPISASGMITNANQSLSLASFAIDESEMMKLEVEVIIAGGLAPVMGIGGIPAGASIKLSVTAFKTGAAVIEVHATELSKEVFGVFGPSLDIVVTEDGDRVYLEATGTGCPNGHEFGCNMQVVKKMKMGQGGVVIEDRS